MPFVQIRTRTGGIIRIEQGSREQAQALIRSIKKAPVNEWMDTSGNGNDPEVHLKIEAIEMLTLEP